jgi:osmoprotectant transport system permease protein
VENFVEQLHILPANLANHLMITVIALTLGVMISLPLAVFVVKHPRLRYPTLTAVSIVQTIPSLALLALMVPLLAGLSALTAWALGLQFGALGFNPTVIALTLYSMLPIVRNTVTGITGVDASLVEAANGVGMSPRQVLWNVELPLAAPVIIAGIRTATVWVVGIATLATPVGQRCLGNYIFRGLQTRNWTAVLFGCIAAAALAMVLDLLIGGVEKAVRDGNRRLGAISALTLAIVFITGIAAPAVTRGPTQREVVRIGSKTFTEQYILSSLIVDLLGDAGFNAEERESLGSTVTFDALATGEIDVYVDYSGTIWANHMQRADSPPSKTVLEEMTRWLRDEHGIVCLGALGFENAYGMAMRRDRAVALDITNLHDLAAHAPRMTIGGDYEFFGRPEWRAIRDAYDLRFSDQISYDSTFMYDAVTRGEVDVISAFTSDGRIAAYELIVLPDPLDVIPPYDAVLLLSSDAALKPDLVSALQPLIDAIPVAAMRHANHLVDRPADKKTVPQAAHWLQNETLK